MQKLWQIRPPQGYVTGIHVAVLNTGEENFMTTVEHLVMGPRNQNFYIPAGFKFDFASIPKMARWFISKTDSRIVQAALVHDWLYANRIGTRKAADAVFLEIMKQEGMPWYKRNTAWFAVRLGGGFAWRT